ncbi:MAG: hypothetical protein PSV16_04030 [Flavobacterium sp.]|nr:hypothetical protein [Flavobacterium sp.]
MKLNFESISQIKKLYTLKLTGWIIWVLEIIYGKSTLDSKLVKLRSLKKGSVGRKVAEMLDEKGYRLIPKFENHDLKHIVLEYEMTMKDEIKMQAYLVGNGNLTLPCLIFLSLAIFYPIIWKDLFKEYKNGKDANSIHYLTLDNCMRKSLKQIKLEYGRTRNNR